jgi:hypothetical protein
MRLNTKERSMIVTRANLSVVAMAVIFALVGSRFSIADEVPTYNLSPSCRAETATAAGDKSCMKDEQGAREILVKQWSEFAPTDRATCARVEEAGGAPSYVELLTCLQTAKAARKSPAS